MCVGSSPLAPTITTNRAHERLRTERFGPTVAFGFGARMDQQIGPQRLDPVERCLGDGSPTLWLGIRPLIYGSPEPVEYIEV